MNRQEMYRRFRAHSGPWDMVVVGGGATGVGVALDAATRGYSVLLLEQSDFGKGTSSRSTKLIHGGVRYLEQGNISLVMEALKERGLLARNAPHLVHNLAFVVPNYDWWEAPFYGLGLKLYDLLAGKYGFGPSRVLSREETLRHIPTLNTEGLRGGVIYFDGQFDDARLLIHLAATAAAHGAVLLNYARVNTLHKGADGLGDGLIGGLSFEDTETGGTFTAEARVVINATGPFADALRLQADPTAQPIIAPSQGIHLVFERSFLPGDSAIMVPRTNDGRVLFAIPWHGHTVVDTTDTPIAEPVLEPAPFDQEVDFILETAAQYLARKPTRSDVLSVFAGIRPLVRSAVSSNTAALSRDHTVLIDPCGLVTICGGKWTTYRRMAQDAVDQAATLARLPERPSVTADLPIHSTDHAAVDALIRQSPPLAEPLHPKLPYAGAQIVWAVREEMARTVEDVLARRTRALFLNARAAIEMAPKAADLVARELGQGEAWKRAKLEAFLETARHYLLAPS
jgi:glycerol-3-phosphate dehydrogenase